MTHRILLLSGSPRGRGSTSYSLLDYLRKQLEDSGVESDILMLHTVSGEINQIEDLVRALDAANYVVLAAPLYADSLPGHVMDIFSKIVKLRESAKEDSTPRFIAILNCGCLAVA